MEDIVVIDDFLTKDEMTFVDNFFDRDVKWAYGHKTDLSTKIKWFVCSLKENPFFTDYLLSKINKLTKYEWSFENVYANGQTMLLDGGWHKDRTADMTAILYVSDITPQNIKNVNGYLNYKINNEIKSIEPYKNRLVIFNSDVVHRGLAPNDPGVFRISIAWKLKNK